VQPVRGSPLRPHRSGASRPAARPHAPSAGRVRAQTGWLVTVASLGDSRAALDTGAAVVPLSVDHRVATHKGERRRLDALGVQIAPIDVSGARARPHRPRDLRWPLQLTLGLAVCPQSPRCVLQQGPP